MGGATTEKQKHRSLVGPVGFCVQPVPRTNKKWRETEWPTERQPILPHGNVETAIGWRKVEKKTRGIGWQQLRKIDGKAKGNAKVEEISSHLPALFIIQRVPISNSQNPNESGTFSESSVFHAFIRRTSVQGRAPTGRVGKGHPMGTWHGCACRPAPDILGIFAANIQYHLKTTNFTRFLLRFGATLART